jgi:dihydroorotate dehydrogenase (fumarate)
MNLTTEYLGLTLKNPLMPGASPMTANPDFVRRLEDAGAAAIVMNSLFEEQITLEENARLHHVEMHTESFSEALNYFPQMDDFLFTTQQYLDQIALIKESVSVPVIASLNGVTPGGWVDCASKIAEAGADALELNFYDIPTDPDDSALDVEMRAIQIVLAIKQCVKIPFAVKLSPFFSSLPNFSADLVAAGADGLIFFNRFYQPDLDIEELAVQPALRLSDSSELLLRLRWLAIVSACVDTSFAAGGGVHGATDALKAIMSGAHAVQLVSVLLKRGPEYLQTVLNEMVDWLDQHEYESIPQIRGCMNMKKSPDPSAFERGNYMRVLQGWRV